MKKVEKMIHDPMRCLGCGKGNTPDGQTGNVGPFVDLEQEVGWLDHAYLCDSCATQAGAIVGMISEDEYKDLKRMLTIKNETIHELESKTTELARRLKATQRRLTRV